MRTMLYFDDLIKRYEEEKEWDKSLIYLEELYKKKKSIETLNSLVGFSWYYLIEGPIDSKKYEKDENKLPLEIWQKYLEFGLQKHIEEPTFCFIAGYTLLLHGFFMQKFQDNYREQAIILINKAYLNSNDNLKKIAKNILSKEEGGKRNNNNYLGKDIIKIVFNSESLLDKYFVEVLSFESLKK